MNTHSSLIVGEYIWDRTTHNLHLDTSDGKTETSEKTLTLKQQSLLECLVIAAPNTLSKADIVRQVWGTEHVSPESLPQLINRTRQTLKDTDKKIIENVPGVGYKLNFTGYESKAVSEHPIKIETQAESRPDQRDTSTQHIAINKKNTRLNISTIKIIVIFIVSLLSFLNIANFYSAYTIKNDFLNARFNQKYSHIGTKNADGSTNITVYDHNCTYDKISRTLRCE